ncbi:hypothetical protein [Selenomonas noxia]|uniref:type II toxin-antitoxin system RelE/ParE family toxin n=1 Tax=Selenomonas noxia TaxID=135083 RepID=UPI002889874F|nr:hypothetical protein [Selenomonas noxia]
MNIAFKTNKLEKTCNNHQAAIKTWGEQIARKIVQRLNEFRAADTLAVISHLPPPRLHKLKGKREGEYAVDLVQPVRLIFKVDQSPLPLLTDGGVDHSMVTSIMILEVEDYHGKQKR